MIIIVAVVVVVLALLASQVRGQSGTTQTVGWPPPGAIHDHFSENNYA